MYIPQEKKKEISPGRVGYERRRREKGKGRVRVRVEEEKTFLVTFFGGKVEKGGKRKKKGNLATQEGEGKKGEGGDHPPLSFCRGGKVEGNGGRGRGELWRSEVLWGKTKGGERKGRRS